MIATQKENNQKNISFYIKLSLEKVNTKILSRLFVQSFERYLNDYSSLYFWIGNKNLLIKKGKGSTIVKLIINIWFFVIISL